MKPLSRGLAVAAIQCLIVLSLAGKYRWDRERLPRVWVNVTPVDPNVPLRGRYVSLRLRVESDAASSGAWIPVRLSIMNGKLAAKAELASDLTMWHQGDTWLLNEPLAFFIPEHARDPSARANGEELWAEVSVPESGMPRPIRLGVKKDGVLTPLDLR